MNAGSFICCGTGCAPGQGFVALCAWAPTASETAKITLRTRIFRSPRMADRETAEAETQSSLHTGAHVFARSCGTQIFIRLWERYRKEGSWKSFAVCLRPIVRLLDNDSRVKE